MYKCVCAEGWGMRAGASVCARALVQVCVCACARRCVYVRLGVVLLVQNGCIPLTMLADVCQCCCLLMFVCLPLSRHFPCCKTW